MRPFVLFPTAYLRQKYISHYVLTFTQLLMMRPFVLFPTAYLREKHNLSEYVHYCVYIVSNSDLSCCFQRLNTVKSTKVGIMSIITY